MTVTRRDVLRTGWKVGGGLLVLAAGWTSYELLRPLAASGTGAKLKLGDPANYPKGTATYVNQGRLYVVNPDGKRLLALSQKCPHLGCRVPWNDKTTRFECPCHGSVFDIGGEWIQGPAPRGMDQYAIGIEDNAVVVDTSKSITGPDRGANAYRTV